jgi:hypothetical protein
MDGTQEVRSEGGMIWHSGLGMPNLPRLIKILLSKSSIWGRARRALACDGFPRCVRGRRELTC